MTTIAISGKVKKRLMAIGKKGETFENILVKLLDSYDNRKEQEGSDTPKSGDKELGGET